MDLPNIVNYERRCHRPTQTWNIHQRTFIKCNFYYSEQLAFVCLGQLQYIATVCFQNDIFNSIGNQRNTPDSNRVKSPLYTTKIYKLESTCLPNVLKSQPKLKSWLVQTVCPATHFQDTRSSDIVNSTTTEPIFTAGEPNSQPMNRNV